MNIEEIRKNKPEGATHYEIDGDDVSYYAKDYIGRWCAVDENGDAWPMRSADHEKYESKLKPIN